MSRYRGHVIASTACMGGELSTAAYNMTLAEGVNDLASAQQFYNQICDFMNFCINTFGEDFYIELQDHGLQEQKDSNPALMEIAEQLNIKTVITNDSHYLRAQDAAWHDTLLCEQTKSAKSNPNRFKFSVNEFYVKTREEMEEVLNMK